MAQGAGGDGTLSAYGWTRHHSGWYGRLPGGRRTLLGRSIDVACDVDTRTVDFGMVGKPVTEDPPPISPAQAALLGLVTSNLTAILPRVEEAMRSYNREEPDFAESVGAAHVWLDYDQDDGRSWTFVITPSGESDFAWHVEFEGLELRSVWAGS